MGSPGRKRKAGRRAQSNRPSRAGAASPFDYGTERVAGLKLRFGDHYSTALGRAFASGLLGDGSDAKERLDIGNRFGSLYRRLLGGDRYRCALNDNPRGGSSWDNPREPEETAWLLDAIDRANRSGGRPFLDQLLSREYTDHGPVWLDRLLAVKDRRDDIVLNAAIRAIDFIAKRAS